jgi:hypothetical protein
MTSVCPGGSTSSAQAGFGTAIYVGPAMIGALLNNIPTPWAVFFAGLIGAITYDLTTFCPGEPPAVPTITAADGVALLQGVDPLARADAIAKFQQLVGAYMWYRVCKCDTLPTPAPPTAPAEPSGWPQVNPPGVAPCWDITLTYKATFAQPAVYKPQLLPGTQPDVFTTQLQEPRPTAITVTVKSNADGTTNGTYTLQLVGRSDPSGSNLQTVSVTALAGATTTSTITLDPRVTFIQLPLTAGTTGMNNSATVRVEYNCSSQPGPIIQTPCCPPDANLVGMVQSLLTTVTLLQRGLLPFAYIAGTVHSGLSGAGSFSVQGLIGVRLQVTTNPGYTGIEAGTPPRLFDVGLVSLSTPDGLIDQRQIRATETVWTPRLMSEATVIGYYLNPGVVASITELEREP